jgi:hypothetical protein
MRRTAESLLLFVVFGAFACTSSVRDGSPIGNNTAATPTGASVQRTATPKPTPADESGELKADFQGTAGITDKKHEVSEAALLTDVRTGRHDGFDRIVFEFAGAELPGYHIEYIDKPVRACGSGNVVQLPGDAWLEVRFEPANAHTEDGRPTATFRELTPKLPAVLELKPTCDFEAQVEWVAGLTSPNRYRVLELRSPTRLVFDIKHK